MLSATKSQFIDCLIQEKVLKFGDYILKSGMRSPFFLNFGNIASSEALKRTGKLFATTLSDFFPKATHVYGPPYKGISLATATVIMHQNPNLAMFYSRKEEKGHGEKGIFIGNTPDVNSTVVMIDDVMTTGETKLQAITLLEETFPIKVAGIIVAVDRRREQEREEFSIPLKAILDLVDFIDYLKIKDPAQADILNAFYKGVNHG
ncbi:MAG: orotate phosphoribosyltransferase [Candidatus Marinimicrobia bacterium]|nr:orotate phosphoribosyltransferase [Candidatus Neomarinimicrobiota bacterium]MDD5582135.1 orotate phosphoribosyltransferase [Candidatus Neomarinimicrobiota bacterium]